MRLIARIVETRLNSGIGNWLMLLGIVLLLVGLAMKSGLLGWFGALPGDIAIKRDGFRFYLPIASMIVISVVLSLLFSLIRRFL